MRGHDGSASVRVVNPRNANKMPIEFELSEAFLRSRLLADASEKVGKIHETKFQRRSAKPSSRRRAQGG